MSPESLQSLAVAGSNPILKGESVMTPLKPLRLTDDQKAVRGVPLDATMFAWACPLPHATLRFGGGLEPSTPEEMAAVYGAFACALQPQHSTARATAQRAPQHSARHSTARTTANVPPADVA